MKVIFMIVLLIYCSVVSGKRAIATLLSGQKANAERYTRLLHFFVYSLRNAGYDGEIMVMYVDDFPVDAKKLSEKLNVKTKLVEKINVVDTTGRGNPHYSSMLTKLHLWNLLEYEQVMYYDCDFIFQGNPSPAFGECSWSNFCATPDTGMHNFNRAIKPGTYFNGGFMVLKPNRSTYKYLLSNVHLANNKFFVEQDLLNQVYQNKWGKLNQKYNLMHCYQLGEIPNSVVAIHEKMWILREKFPQLRYIWNSSKMQIQYPISEVLTLPRKPGGAPPPPAIQPPVPLPLPTEVVKMLMTQQANPFRPVQPSTIATTTAADTNTNTNINTNTDTTTNSATNTVDSNNPSQGLNPRLFNTDHTIPVPPSIAHNATATEIYRTFVMEQIQSKQLKSSHKTHTTQATHSHHHTKSVNTPLLADSINKAPKKVNKFARKPIPGPHKQPKKNKHKAPLNEP